MADTRQAERDMSQAARDTARKTAEQTSRAARAVTDAGAETSRLGAEMLQRNAETLQQAWDTGTKIASQFAEQSMKSLASAFGVPGEAGRNAAEQSTRNLESIAQSGTVITNGMQAISREMVEFARKRMERNMERVDALTNCRTPHDVVEAQTEFARDNLEDFVQSTRRIAELALQMADEASRRINEVSSAPR
jgi:phasin family protein